MVEHLTREEISLLLDEPETLPGGAEHLARCDVCSHEYERMSRIRMALSALPGLEPPADEWNRIEAELGLVEATAGVARWWILRNRWPLQAAAVLLLFAGGLLVGQRLAPSSSQPETSPVPQLVERSSGDPLTAGLGSEQDSRYLRTVAELQELRQAGLTADDQDWMEDPAAVVERITHLNAIIDASTEALETAPADPVLNNFLFEVVDERDQLTGRLDATLRVTAEAY